MEHITLTTVATLGAAAGLGTLWVLRRPTQTIASHQTGLLYRKGQYAETLGPGVYRLWLATTDLKVYDTRETLHDVGSQEIPTKDGVSARFTVALRLRIADPLLIETKVVNWLSAVHSAAQLALRDGVAAATLAELLEDRKRLDADMNAALVPQLAAFGVELIEARVRDIAVSAELRNAFAARAKAAAEARAKLEHTRGETASLRAMANAGRLLESNKGLARLQALQTAQAAAEGAGNKLVVNLDASAPLTDE